uniref:Calcineurin B-like protein 1 isoform X2 n=1 Tax=Rhizophora mucronata TaxID=61149 RepID=A0A2P2LL08_RHIMU
MLLNNSNSASTSLTLKAVWDARGIGSSCPGNCLATLEPKQPIYW